LRSGGASEEADLHGRLAPPLEGGVKYAVVRFRCDAGKAGQARIRDDWCDGFRREKGFIGR